MMAKMLTKLAGFRISKHQARRLVLDAVLGLALFLSLMYSFFNVDSSDGRKGGIMNNDAKKKSPQPLK